jgi:NADPH:quinone reductase-like Zn-dependent oxidoreductase
MPGRTYTLAGLRQVVIARHGAPDVLEVREGPDPTPREGEVRIAVRAAGVNFADILARLGLYPDAPPPPVVVGYEVSGYVDAVGPGTVARHVGDHVVALTRFGGYSTAVVVPAALTVPVPAGVSDAEAAAVPVNYLTALLALYRMANVAAHETVLIHGVGGGVGIAAAQLARLRRARIIGTASPAKHETVRSLGVDDVVDYRRPDFADEVRRLTGGRGADVILDPIGGRSFRTSYSLLAPLGRLIVFGVSSIATGERRRWWHAAATMMRMPVFRPLSLMNNNRAVIGLNLGHLWGERQQLGAGMELLVGELAAGRIKPVVAKTFPLDRAADAHRFIQSRSNIGKVVLMAGATAGTSPN